MTYNHMSKRVEPHFDPRLSEQNSLHLLHSTSPTHHYHECSLLSIMAEDIKIARAPDVILIVGDAESTRLLVSSEVLMESSKVFAALLGPKFQEGQETGTVIHPKEVTLKEDNAAAMSDM